MIYYADVDICELVNYIRLSFGGEPLIWISTDEKDIRAYVERMWSVCGAYVERMWGSFERILKVV